MNVCDASNCRLRTLRLIVRPPLEAQQSAFPQTDLYQAIYRTYSADTESVLVNDFKYNNKTGYKMPSEQPYICLSELLWEERGCEFMLVQLSTVEKALMVNFPTDRQC